MLNLSQRLTKATSLIQSALLKGHYSLLSVAVNILRDIFYQGDSSVKSDRYVITVFSFHTVMGIAKSPLILYNFDTHIFDSQIQKEGLLEKLNKSGETRFIIAKYLLFVEWIVRIHCPLIV